MDTSHLSRPQKVAAVMLALGTEQAEAILKHLPDSEVEQVAQEVVALGPLSPQQMHSVLEEFYAEARAQREMLSGGEHTARELLRAWRGDRGDQIVDRLVASVRQAPFGFLTYFSPDDIARQLREEHPQMAAVVLSNVSTRLAAQVLEALPERTRADVAIRIATIEPSPPELVARIEENLRARLGDASSAPIGLSGASGLRELANMLNNTELELARTILESIEQVDERLAKEIRAQMFVFTDLTTLPDRDLQEVLRQIETSQLALAMKGLDGELYDSIMRNLSERARTGLTEELELLGPVKASDIELARAEIAAHVRQLADEGTVTIMRDGSDLVV
ncbi:MAG TPA: flagellar motor switch protein FliG [Euzebyales bacterium]|nr:flagellar motor switch protein FliG [Euzebyales bacterium]